MPPAGVEPATLGLLDPRSNRLSYGGSVRAVTGTDTDWFWHLSHFEMLWSNIACYCNVFRLHRSSERKTLTSVVDNRKAEDTPGLKAGKFVNVGVEEGTSETKQITFRPGKLRDR